MTIKDYYLIYNDEGQIMTFKTKNPNYHHLILPCNYSKLYPCISKCFTKMIDLEKAEMLKSFKEKRYKCQTLNNKLYKTKIEYIKIFYAYYNDFMKEELLKIIDSCEKDEVTLQMLSTKEVKDYILYKESNDICLNESINYLERKLIK